MPLAYAMPFRRDGLCGLDDNIYAAPYFGDAFAADYHIRRDLQYT